MGIGLTINGKFKRIEELNDVELGFFFDKIKIANLDSLDFYKRIISLYCKK
jgi:hypothetical protein